LNLDSKILKIPDLLDHNKFIEIQKMSRLLSTIPKFLDWDPKFNRYTGHNLSLFLAVLPEIQKKMSQIQGLPSLDFTFCYFSHYVKFGICPPHTDRKECEWTLNFCINQNFSWPIIIDGTAIHMRPNEAIIYKGASLKHWRDINLSEEECDLCVYCFKESK
jgi:hypothetical protein